jgi:hypothetical protein
MSLTQDIGFGYSESVRWQRGQMSPSGLRRHQSTRLVLPVGDASPTTPQPRVGEFSIADVVILLAIDNVPGNELHLSR